jgi:penicillin amidase
LILLVLLSVGLGWWALHASLAQLDGQRVLPGLGALVQIERDSLGVPTIHATNRLDATRALGFLHAQDRFFEMDLTRRAGAGELSELFGPVVLDRDREQRIHRPRSRARQALERATSAELELLKAYAEGVNGGLRALLVRPPEYLAIRTEPAPWRLEDTYLVAYAMFAELHDIDGSGDYRELSLRKTFAPAALAFFNSPDTLWNAALDGSEIAAPAIPTPEQFRVDESGHQARANGSASTSNGEPEHSPKRSPARDRTIGSNSWAVDGHRSGTGAAIVANDMHLGLNVPNIWYRARLVYNDPELGLQDVTGVTLPGTPVVVSGSNRHVGWANTASTLDITDLVSIEFDPSNAHRYRTATGWREVERFTEIIPVRGRTSMSLEVEETIWGPLVAKGTERYALACTLHDAGAVNMGLIEIERARDVEEALHIGNLAGTPVNNFIVGDRAGHIGYSILGRLPNRVGFDGSVPTSWADGSRGWQGWLPPERYPRVANPEKGILWSANNRTLGSMEYQLLRPDPDDGARARQVRDDLLEIEKPTEEALWSIYHDDRALFLTSWQKVMLSTLETGSTTNTNWQELQRLVANWGAHAAVQSQGYRLVRAFRERVMDLLFDPVSRKLRAYNDGMRIYNEDAAQAMLKARPPHLLNPKFKTYEDLLGEAVNMLLAELKARNIPLAQATWGSRNRLQIRHPISYAVAKLSRWLDMPDAPISGDSHMPKVHAPGVGVSERMIVSPGHEENGLYNMPCGQSGHFLSPFYRTEMDAWLKVKPLPFLPGASEHELKLLPR